MSYTYSRSRFSGMLSRAERLAEIPALRPQFLEVARDLSSQACGPMAQELADDPGLRARWDAVFAATDSDDRLFLPEPPPDRQARLLVSLVEDYLRAGAFGPCLDACVDTVTALEREHGLDRLFGDTLWLERYSDSVAAYRELRRAG